jgi:PBP1b-binding outer membrane lipoprotein LpoB
MKTKVIGIIFLASILLLSGCTLGQSPPPASNNSQVPINTPGVSNQEQINPNDLLDKLPLPVNPAPIVEETDPEVIEEKETLEEELNENGVETVEELLQISG